MGTSYKILKKARFLQLIHGLLIVYLSTHYVLMPFFRAFSINIAVKSIIDLWFLFQFYFFYRLHLAPAAKSPSDITIPFVLGVWGSCLKISYIFLDLFFVQKFNDHHLSGILAEGSSLIFYFILWQNLDFLHSFSWDWRLWGKAVFLGSLLAFISQKVTLPLPHFLLSKDMVPNIPYISATPTSDSSKTREAAITFWLPSTLTFSFSITITKQGFSQRIYRFPAHTQTIQIENLRSHPLNLRFFSLKQTQKNFSWVNKGVRTLPAQSAQQSINRSKIAEEDDAVLLVQALPDLGLGEIVIILGQGLNLPQKNFFEIHKNDLLLQRIKNAH